MIFVGVKCKKCLVIVKNTPLFGFEKWRESERKRIGRRRRRRGGRRRRSERETGDHPCRRGLEALARDATMQLATSWRGGRFEGRLGRATTARRFRSAPRPTHAQRIRRQLVRPPARLPSPPPSWGATAQNPRDTRADNKITNP